MPTDDWKKRLGATREVKFRDAIRRRLKIEIDLTDIVEVPRDTLISRHGRRL